MNTAIAEKPVKPAVITVAHIRPSDSPNKSASIKDADGIWFSIWPNKLGLTREGDSYEIEYTETVKNGVTYRDIKGTPRHITPHGHQASESSEERAAQKVSDVARNAQQAAKAQTPRALAYNNNPGAAVMGMVNQYVGRGDVPLDDEAIARAIDVCLAGYLKSKLAA